MKTTRILAFAGLFLFMAANSFAQPVSVPRSSSRQTIEQDLGLGKVTLSYSRPNVHGRTVFGELVPYGAVWRMGANSATSIKFTDEVTVEGNKVPAGEYGLFAIPGPDEWVIILNKTSRQWGAYSYKQEDDLVRFKVKPLQESASTETMTFWFGNVDKTTCELEMRWEKSGFRLHISTDVDAKVMADIDKVMNNDNKPYFTAAQYYYENGKDLNKALEWISVAEKSDPKSTGYKLWKARILLKMGRKAEALATAQEGVKLAAAENNKEYVYLNQVVVDLAKK